MLHKRITILYPFRGNTLGGGHISIISMIKILDKKKFRPLVLLHEDGLLRKLLEKEKISFITKKKIKVVDSNSIKDFFFNSMKNFKTINNFLINEKVDIVHTNDGRMQATWNIPVLFSRKKFIWHIRSRDNSRRLIIYSIFANEILAVSNFCKNNLPSSFNKRVKIIKNFFSHSIPSKKSKKSNKKIIAYVANYKQQKRPELFFKIANEILNANIKHIYFYIFGNYNNKEKNNLLKLIKKEGDKNKISFMGHKFPIGPWLEKAMMTLSLGKDEGFGRVLIESMLNKSLVIATSGGAHDEIIKNNYNGIIVKSFDPKEISKKVLFYLKNKTQLKRITETAFLDSKENFITFNNSKEIEKLYYDIL